MKILLAALAFAIFAVPCFAQLSNTETKIAKKLMASMTLEQRKAFGGAIRSVTGAGKLTGKEVLERAPRAMRPKEKPVWAAYVKKLKPDQLSVLKKVLQNAAASQRGEMGVGASGG